jgi:hypothetical protein
MNKSLISLTGVCAVLAAVPLLTLGADSPPPMDLMKVPPNAASFMCRTAGANEKSTGTIGSQAVVCKTAQAMMVGTMMKVPKTTGLDRSAADKAWRDWVNQVLIIGPPRSGDG